MALLTATAEVEVVAHAVVGEGPLWDAERGVLHWVDIPNATIHTYDPPNKQSTFIDLKKNGYESVGTIGLTTEPGVLIAATNMGFILVDTLDCGAVTTLVDPEAGKPANRFNDGKPGPGGRFWAGTLMNDESDPQAEGAGTVYVLDPETGEARVAFDGTTVSNGMDWSTDLKTFYFADSPTLNVYRFDYDIETGTVSNKDIFVTIPVGEGYPDGLCVDASDRVWVALWGGSSVVGFDKSGNRVGVVNVPARFTSCCAFGGTDYGTMYITTATRDCTEEDYEKLPLSGSLFSARIEGVSGKPPFAYAGGTADRL